MWFTQFSTPCDNSLITVGFLFPPGLLKLFAQVQTVVHSHSTCCPPFSLCRDSRFCCISAKPRHEGNATAVYAVGKQATWPHVKQFNRQNELMLLYSNQLMWYVKPNQYATSSYMLPENGLCQIYLKKNCQYGLNWKIYHDPIKDVNLFFWKTIQNVCVM